MDKFTYQSEIGDLSIDVAKGSFAVGTLLLLVGLVLPGNMAILTIGFFYVLIAGIINILTLIALLACCLAVWDYRKYYTIRMLILLANLPIAIFYFF